MQETYRDGLAYYLLNAFPLALAQGIVFFLLGMLVGWLFWRSRQERAELSELANLQLEEEQERLAQQLIRARRAQRSTSDPETC